MMTEEKIKRINELAKKAKKEKLTDAEKEEQQILRREYIDAFKANLRAQLENIEFTDENVEKQIKEDEEEISEEIKEELER